MHPLVVIFGLLVGESPAGPTGVLLAIPMVVVAKDSVTFAMERPGSAEAPPEREGRNEPAPRWPDAPSRVIDAPQLRCGP